MKKNNRIYVLLLTILFTFITTGISNAVPKKKPKKTYTTEELCKNSGGDFDGDEHINSCCWDDPPECEFCEITSEKTTCNVVRDTNPGGGRRPIFTAPSLGVMAPKTATNPTPSTPKSSSFKPSLPSISVPTCQSRPAGCVPKPNLPVNQKTAPNALVIKRKDYTSKRAFKSALRTAVESNTSGPTAPNNAKCKKAKKGFYKCKWGGKKYYCNNQKKNCTVAIKK